MVTVRLWLLGPPIEQPRRQQMKKISAVYKIMNEVTGDFYIGSSKNVRRRWKEHKSPSVWKQHPNNPMYKDMQKYGVDKFMFQILVPVMPEYLTQVEQEFIKMLNPTYNNNNAKGWDVEKRKEASRKYYSKLCEYNGETLTLNALTCRFKRMKIPHAMLEAKKYLITTTQKQIETK